MKLMTESRPSSTDWTVESIDSAEGAVAALELLLAPNALRLQHLSTQWSAGIVLVGAGPGRGFALLWDDGQRVHTVASDTFAGACALFSREKQRLEEAQGSGRALQSLTFTG